MSVTETTQDRAAPIRPNQGPVAWVRANLFSTWYNALLTLLIGWLLVRTIPGIIDWTLVKASWTGDAAPAGPFWRRSGASSCSGPSRMISIGVRHWPSCR